MSLKKPESEGKSIHAGPARRHTMTIIAQDPSVRASKQRVLVAQVPVPADPLAPGPRSHRFHVVDYDASRRQLQPPAVLTTGADVASWDYSDRFAGASGIDLVGDFAFHAQNTYAIAARTLASFESALGRRLTWGFASPQLFLVPHAFAEANAYYAAEDRALYFGYTPGAVPVYTCLSHDVVAHETTHAVLDGLRPRYVEPGLPDQAAFHEALADVVALLSVFSIDEVVANLLGRADAQGRIAAAQVSERSLRDSALLGLAEQLGSALSGGRADALRRSVELAPSPDWQSDLAFEEPHRRGEVFVAAVMRSLVGLWRGRLDALVHGGGLDRDRAAEEGASAAAHLLGMACRAIDYCPPVELEFGDFLDALLVSDTAVVPDDRHHYRDTVVEAFAGYGIAPAGTIADLGPVGGRLDYHNVNHTALRADRDEVYRFIWQNAETLRIDRTQWLQVASVRPSVRVGPDGLTVAEAVADYVQALEAPAGALAELGLQLPDGLDPDTEIQLWGGGVLVFDQFGRAIHHQSKALGDWDRQSRRLDYLVRAGLSDTAGRFGFSLGTPRGQHFAELHAVATNPGESW